MVGIQNISKRTLYCIVCLLLLLTQCIFAGYGVVSILFLKEDKIDVFLFMFCRLPLCAIASVVLALCFEPRPFLINPKKPIIYAYFVIFGALAAFGTSVMYLYCIMFTSASFAAIMSQMIPIFNLILSYIFKIEQVSSLRSPKLILQVLGVMVASSTAVATSVVGFQYPDKNITARDWVIGSLIGLANNLSYSLFLILQARLFYRNKNSEFSTRPLTINAYCNVMGYIAYLPFAIPYLIVRKDVFNNLKTRTLIPIFYGGLLLSALGYGLMMWCNRHSSPLLAGISYSLQMFIMLIMLRIFTSEKLYTAQYIFGVVTAFGVMLVIFAPYVEKYLKKKNQVSKPSN